MDHDEHLRIHDELFKDLASLNTRMVVAIERIDKSLEIVIQLLQERRNNDSSNGV